MMVPPWPERVHVPQAGARGQKGSVEMDGHDLLPVAEGQLVDAANDLVAGVAAQNIDAAVFCEWLVRLPAPPTSSLVTSMARPIAWPPVVAAISAAAASACACSRSAITTLAPSAAKRWAMPRPMPEAAPVTMATFPFLQQALIK